MAAGDWVMAIGNPFGYAHTVTVGVISATERPFPVTDGRIERHAPDRRGDQPGQLGRAAAQPARRGDRHEHRDHHQRPQPRATSASASPCRSTRSAICCRSCTPGKVDPRPHRRVRCSAVPREGFEDFGLKSRTGAVVAQVVAGRRRGEGRHRAGRRDHRVQRPAGHEHDELREDGRRDQAGHVGAGEGAAQQAGEDAERRRSTSSTSRPSRTPPAAAQQRVSEPPEEQGADSFGLTLENLTPQIARRLQLPSGQSGAVVTDVDPDGPSAGALRPGRRHPVGQRAGRCRARPTRRASCRRSQSGRIAQILRLARRRRGVRARSRRNERNRRLQIADCRVQIADR